ncbi:response regulator [Rhodospirillum centenum]|uniref:Transcriptional regulatory protein FixJ n=1 Tax=Rhodospirillum centenum (strain ATCC 51521 / SW) TaxID=414684 RepID=B6IYM3_RHOCS|nr:response regulator [Rhodospirillum centenum]ACJ01397.1 transcriptional regulatory protein FixJ [Rhodospirillum centenum SW]
MPAALVVDDDPDIRRLLRRLLHQRGWSVREAASGGEGVAAVRDSRPDLLFTDIFMSGGTGIDLLHALAPHRAGLTVVVMSGDSHHDGIDQFQLALSLGASATLPKPFDAAMIDAILQAHLPR